MIEFSIDRLANVFNIDIPSNIEDDFSYKKMHFDTLGNVILDSLNKYKPDDVVIDYVNFGLTIQYYWVTFTEKEPLFNLQVLDYSNGLRFDFNPKRVRSNVWLSSVIDDVKEYAKTNGFNSHNTQVDLALDFINHGPLVDSMRYVRFGVKRTALFHDISGNIETEYFGKKGSSSYLRIYNKRAERLHQITLKFAKMKRVIKKKYSELLSDFPNITHNELTDYFPDLEFDVVLPMMNSDVDFVRPDDFETALDLILSMLKENDVNSVPASWKRFEIVLRTKKLSDDRVTFDNSAVLDYLNGISNFDLETISDYKIRSLILGVENGYVKLSELSDFEKQIRKCIYKSNEVVVYRNSSRRYFAKTREDFDLTVDLSKVTVTKIIKKQDDQTLRNEVITEFEKVKDDLKSELWTYSIN